MKVEYYKFYSYNLDRDMEFKVFGHAGKPILVFPCQDGRFFDYENQGMIETISGYINDGRIQVFCVDSIDTETWSFMTERDSRYCMEMHERYYNYICNEFYPVAMDINEEANGYRADGMITNGCSMGAAHSANFFFRRPDLFSGCIALSGVYDMSFFAKGYQDDIFYQNSPIHYLDGMPYDHPYVEMYRNRSIMICVGQGAWEHPMIEDTLRVKELLGYKNVPNDIEVWGYDVCHDWPWWKIQMPHFLDKIC